MSVPAVAHGASAGGSFRHEALLYSGEDEFLEGVGPFVEEGLARHEGVLVVAAPEKTRALRSMLGNHRRLRFDDMYELGRNPGRILSAWREFAEEQRAAGRRPRGVGEPVWSGRSSEELVECLHHEALLNLAFDGEPWSLLCPYDTSALDATVIEEVGRTHPFLVEAGTSRPSDVYPGAGELDPPFDTPLSPPPAGHGELAFGLEDLPALRRTVEDLAVDVVSEHHRREGLVLAVTEIATNSVRHAGGRGTLLTWDEQDRLVFEVRDRGRITDPLVGRQPPAPEEEGGRGIWLAHQLCDLVQLRSGDWGTAVRLHFRR